MNRVKNKQVVIRALGTMSGTSLDGVDAAVLETDGTRIVGFGPSAFRPYSRQERAVIQRAFGQWEGPDVAAAAETVEMAHAAVLGEFDLPDLVGFHGQTLSHAPEAGQSLQAGDGSLLAEALGAPVVWDFRSADMVLGGQGAPLAPFYHHACARWIGADAPLAFLNLGGVGNLTWVDPRIAEPDEPGALLAFDTGPANAPINDLMLARRGQAQDRGGALAATGDVEEAALEAFLADPYFSRVPPKSLDRNAFSEIVKVAEALNDADAVATLTAMAAVAVAQGLDHCPSPPGEILVAGGGRHNPVLMAMIQAGVPCPVRPVEEVGLDGDMLEAHAFAYLAVRVARGLPTSCPSTTGVRAAISGGTLSWPGA